MARLSNPDIATICNQEIDLGEGGRSSSSQLSEDRRKAWNYYLGRPRGDEDADRSQVQSLDLADQVENMLAQMMSAFTTDTPAEFEPDAQGDDSQAEVESAAVNKILMEDNPGYEILYQAIKDALLFKNGIIKVWSEDMVRHETVTYDDLSAEEAALLQASMPDEAEATEDDDSVTISLDRDSKKLKIEAIEPANFVYTANWHQQDLQDIPFCAERKFIPRSDLVGMGFSKAKVDKLAPHSTDTQTDTLAKNLGQHSPSSTSTTKGQDLIECHECYVMLPEKLNSGASVSERWRVFMAGENVILDKEKVSIVPYVSGTAFIVPHRFSGLSLYDKLKEIQDIKTALTRQGIDNQAHMNGGRGFVTGDVNREELGISAPGHHITGGLNSTFTPLQMQDFGPSSIQWLNYMDKQRSERAGAAIDLGSAESQLVSSSIGAAGVALVMGAAEQMSAFMTRTLSETLIRRLFMLVHRTAREVWRQPMMMRKADQWIQVDPGQWRERKRVNVKTGLSPGERARKVAALDKVLQTQLGMMQAGLPMVTPKNLYIAWMNREKAAELDNPEQYAVHYESQEAQQMSQQQGQQQQQQLAMQKELAELPEKMKLMLAQMEDKRERDLAILKAEIEEAKIVGQATKDLALEQLRARGSDQSGEGSPAGGNGAAG